MKVWNRRDPNLPLDAIYVGRGTPWGNPFRMARHNDVERSQVIYAFRQRLADMKITNPAGYEQLLAPLRGKDLVCWCAPKPCHADVLLELANR